MRIKFQAIEHAFEKTEYRCQNSNCYQIEVFPVHFLLIMSFEKGANLPLPYPLGSTIFFVLKATFNSVHQQGLIIHKLKITFSIEQRYSLRLKASHGRIQLSQSESVGIRAIAQSTGTHTAFGFVPEVKKLQN